jgi:hypothetical protein
MASRYPATTVAMTEIADALSIARSAALTIAARGLGDSRRVRVSASRAW